jgi:radical SAM protein with 4Fe4S-binding SPASM domain
MTCLPLDIVKEVIDDAKELGAGTICISGGEPFLYPELLEVVDYIHEHGLQTYIYSSGVTYVDGKPSSVPSEVLETLDGKIEKLIVNVEAADSKTYDEIMGTSFGGFEMMKQTIQTAVEMGIVVEAHMVPMKINYKLIPAVIKLCRELGVSRLSFLRLVNQGRTAENPGKTLLSTDEYFYVQDKLLELRDYYQHGIRLGIPFQSCSEKVNCQAGTVKMDIRYDGNVYPCEAFKDDMFVINGELVPDNVKTKRLKKIYFESQYLNEIRMLLEGFQRVNTCETCMNQYYRFINE